MIKSYNVPAEDDSKTVKYILKNRFSLSERLVKKLKFNDKIYLGSLPVHVNAIVHEGDVIEAHVDLDETNEDIIPEQIDIDIIYEDDSLIAINKPPNMVVHPTFRHFSGTVANALMYYLLQKGVKTLIRPVSRLDRDTSGIIIFALNSFVQDKLIKQMHTNSYLKEYVGLIHGFVKDCCGTINMPIDRLPGSIMLRHTTPEGAPSVTHYEVIERFGDATFAKFTLETGRTHQIRVHSQAIGHPLIGDTLYPLPLFEGCHEGLMSRQALHSIRTIFKHPVTQKILELSAPIPSDISHALEILRK